MIVRDYSFNRFTTVSGGIPVILLVLPFDSVDPFITETKNELLRLDEGSGSGPCMINTSVRHITPDTFSLHAWDGHHYGEYPMPSLHSPEEYYDFILPDSAKLYRIKSENPNDKFRYHSFRSFEASYPAGTSFGRYHGELSGTMFVELVVSRPYDSVTIDMTALFYATDGSNKFAIYIDPSRHYVSDKTTELALSNYDNEAYMLYEIDNCKNVSWHTFGNHQHDGWSEYSGAYTYSTTVRMLPELYGPNQGEFGFWLSKCLGLPSDVSGPIKVRHFQEAFRMAQEKLPKTSTNGLANALDVVALLRDIRQNPTVTIDRGSKLAKNAWLSYRYAYSTTKADIQEAAELANRLMAIDPIIESYGSVADGTVSYFCELVVTTDQFLPPKTKSLIERLKLYGVELNFTNAWDMIPYSFVVDWFADISSLMQGMDEWLDTSSLDIKEVWYSAINSYPDGRKSYFRWSGSPPGLPSFSQHVSHSGTTWLKRVADAISLYH